MTSSNSAINSHLFDTRLVSSRYRGVCFWPCRLSSRTRTRPTRGEVRDRIFDAASKVFAAEGFAGATIDAIGQAAGFTKGAVYSNFESKDELFLALLDREFELRGEQIATALEAAAATPLPPQAN